MAEDFDVEAMLEAPYKKDDEQHHHHRDHHQSQSHHRSNASPSYGENGSHNGSGSRSKRGDNGRKRSRSGSRGGGRDAEYHHKERSPRGDRDKRDRGTADKGERATEKVDRGSDKDGKVDDRHERRRQNDHGSSKRSSRDRGERRRSRSRDRKERRRSRSKDRKERRKSRSPASRRRSRSRGERGTGDRKRSRSPVVRRKSPIRRKTRSPPPRKHRSPSPRPFRRGRTPPNGLGNRSPPEDLSPEERDARTVFCMQLSQRIRARDLEEFFSSVGKVRDVRLITCNKTKRFKGIAYIEFKDPESVPLALGLSGQKLLSIPICVQHTQAEKNRMANILPTNVPPKNHIGPMRLYVGSLHFNITEDMLRGIFEPFGKIDSIQLIIDPETNRSKGYGFITFHNAEDAKKALEQLNGFELAGRPMKVGNVTERLDVNTNTSLDTDEMDRSGIDLGATGRLQLMFKLAEGAGLAVPQAAANALLASAPQPPPPAPVQPGPSIATQCFLLSNMFDPSSETNPTWDTEITDDVIEECKKHGGVLHVYVDKGSQGNVYVKCPSTTTAVLSVNALHGRWFAGRVITAAYVPLVNYHALFPDALTATALLQTFRKS